MKNLKSIPLMRSILLAMITLVMISPKEAVAENYSSVSFQVFYDELSPYGDWVKDARYGYIWLPAVQQGFHPYGSDGHWVMTGYGNTWVSDYDWGWATFHYGRWYFDNNYRSWAWIPDYEWGPAWVDWRSGGGYYGWAPMGPGFTVNFRVNIPSNYWVFVPQRRFAYRNVYNYYVPYAKRVNIYNNTTIINNTVIYNNNSYYAGPARREIERVTKNSYPVREVRAVSSPGRVAVSKNSVNVYQPNLRNTDKNTAVGTPSRVLSATEARTSRSNPSYSSSNNGSTTTDRSTRRTVHQAGNSVNDNSSSGNSIDYKPYNGRTSPAVTPSRQERSTTNSSTSRSAIPNSNSRGATTQPKPTTRQSPTTQQSRTSTPSPRATENKTERSTVSPSRSSRPEVNTRPAQTNGQNVRSTTSPPSPRSSAPKVNSSTNSNSRTTPTPTPSRTSTSPTRSSRTGNN